MAKNSDHITQETVRVDLGDRSYDIVIGQGLIARAGKMISDVRATRKAAVITDQNVARFHLPTLRKSLEAAGIQSFEIVLPPGEQTKSFGFFGSLLEELLDAKIERSDLVIAFGGGVIGDLAGFAASVLRRGVDFVQIPTTLLAQVDSSVGGKTAIDTKHGKNLVGTFYQPRLVLIDTDVLETLPERELKAGYAEVVKYGLINDAAFFAWLENNGSKLLQGDREARRHAIAVSCKSKAAIVAQDEKEGGVRALLNLGHTFAHALEVAAGFDGDLLHGEAVAIGMNLAFQYSVQKNICSADDAIRVGDHLKATGLLWNVATAITPQPSAKALADAMLQDKKSVGGKPKFILVRGIGQAFIDADVPLDHVESFLKAQLEKI